MGKAARGGKGWLTSASPVPVLELVLVNGESINGHPFHPHTTHALFGLQADVDGIVGWPSLSHYSCAAAICCP